MVQLKFIGFLFLLIILFCSLISAPTKESNLETDAGTEQEGIPKASTEAPPDGYSWSAGSEATEDEEAVPPSFTVNKDAPITKFEEIPEGTEIHTEYGDFTGADFSNLVLGNGGIYEATISGVVAGTTMYFPSTFDDQIFKFTAGSDESAIRVVQFDKNGFTQERIYFDLAEGDIIDQGSLFGENIYHYEAYDDGSIYIYNEDQSSEMKLGEQSYSGIYNESFENPTEDSIITQLTDQGFYNITLNSNSAYTYNLDFLNLTLNNDDEREITICKNSTDICEVYNTGNTFILNGADKSLLQDGYTIVESFDENNVILLNFGEETITLTNIEPTEEILAIIRIGYHEITETKDTIYSKILDEEYPYLFTTYDSDKVIPVLNIENKVLKFEDLARVFSLPNMEEMENNCFNYAYNKIISETDETKPEYCA